MATNSISISELLDNLETYEGNVVEVEGHITELGTVVCYMKADDARWKIKADSRTLFIELSPDEMSVMVNMFYLKGRTYALRDGLVYKFPVKVRGRVEHFNYEPIRARLTDIIYICAKDTYPESLLELGYGDAYMYEVFIEKPHQKNDFTKRFRQKLTILSKPDSKYDIRLNDYNGSIHGVIGKTVQVEGALFHRNPINWKEGKRHHALLGDFTTISNAISNWIWIKRDAYDKIIERVTLRYFANVWKPLFKKLEIIGRLAYVPDGQVAPIDIENPTNLMLEDLRLVVVEQECDLNMDDDLTSRIQY